MNSKMSCLFSIVIATYNGANRIGETLTCISKLALPGNAELIVVNNASTDCTTEIVLETWKQSGSPFPLKFLIQPRQGKSYALALAVEYVEGEFMIICDDDNHLQSDYLQVIHEFFESHKDAGIIGGHSLAITNDGFPDWFGEVAYLYACGKRYNELTDTTGIKPLWSAGLAIRSSLLPIIFAPQIPLQLTGRKGQLIISGEDDEMNYRTWLSGFKSYYVPSLILYHCIPKERLTIDYKEKLLKGFEHQSQLINTYRRLYMCMSEKVPISILVMKKFIGWLWFKWRKKQNILVIYNDILYFLTRKIGYETDTNKIVWDWYESIAIPFLHPQEKPFDSILGEE